MEHITHKHIMFLRSIELYEMNNIFDNTNKSIFLDSKKINYANQEIFFIFDNANIKIIGLKSIVNTLKEIDVFYQITDYIGRIQIKTHRLCLI